MWRTRWIQYFCLTFICNKTLTKEAGNTSNSVLAGSLTQLSFGESGYTLDKAPVYHWTNTVTDTNHFIKGKINPNLLAACGRSIIILLAPHELKPSSMLPGRPHPPFLIRHLEENTCSDITYCGWLHVPINVCSIWKSEKSKLPWCHAGCAFGTSLHFLWDCIIREQLIIFSQLQWN